MSPLFVCALVGAVVAAGVMMAVLSWARRSTPPPVKRDGREVAAWEQPCPCCGVKGRTVTASVVRAMVPNALQEKIPDGDYVFCVNPSCARSNSFSRGGLTVRMGPTGQGGPHLLCACSLEPGAEDGGCRCEIGPPTEKCSPEARGTANPDGATRLPA